MSCDIQNPDFLDNFFKEDSAKLLYCYSRKSLELTFNLLCCRCFGLIIKPVKCKICNFLLCQNCLEISKKGKISCLCKNSLPDNFIPYDIPNVDKIKLRLEDRSDTTYIKNKLFYIQVINNLKAYRVANLSRNFRLVYYYDEEGGEEGYDLVDDDVEHDPTRTEKVLKSKYKQFEQFVIHKSKCHSRFSLKLIKLLKYIKHHPILFQNRMLCEYDVLKLKPFNLREISIIKCRFIMDFSVALARLIYENKYKLEKFTWKKTNESWRTAIPILKSISFCMNLVEFNTSFEYVRYSTTKIQILKEIFVNAKKIKEISLSNLNLVGTDLNCFNGFTLLSSLELEYCTLSQTSFVELINIQKKNKSLANFCFWFNKITKDFSPELKKCANFLNELANLRYLKIGLPLLSEDSSEIRTVFCEYFNISKSIVRLNLSFNDLGEKDVKTFSKYLRETQILKRFKFLSDILISKSDITDSFIQNQSIEYLNLSNNDLTSDSKFISKLISYNKTIKTLLLNDCRINFCSYLLSSLSHNSSIENIYLFKNKLDPNVIEGLKKFEGKNIYLKKNQLNIPDNFQANEENNEEIKEKETKKKAKSVIKGKVVKKGKKV